MSAQPTPSLETRASLLHRLRDSDDIESWRDFYRTYSGLIRSFAEKAGLTPDEAEDVVQETAIGVARGLPGYVYNPKVCRFKTWLLNLTRWRIQDCLRRRGVLQQHASNRPAASERPDRTSTTDGIPDPAVPEFGAEWDAAWDKNLLTRALENVRGKIDDRHFQIFDLNVVKQWPAQQVAKILGITSARVYLVKHRVSLLLKAELRRLETACASSLRS